MDRREHLLALAERCETAEKPDRGLDADIYEALGFTVRRKPSHLVGRRTPMGGIYQQGSLWKALGLVSANIDVAINLLRQRAPEWSWSLRCLAEEDSAAFQALVAESSGNAMLGSLALCAAMLRALARYDGLMVADAPSQDQQRVAVDGRRAPSASLTES